MPIGTTDIKFSDIQTEFGGSNPIGLSEYYRTVGNGGEVLVPNAPAAQTVSAGGITYVVSQGTSGIPTSGVISVNDFNSKSKAVTISATITTNQPDFNLLSAIYTALGSFYAPIVCTCTINNGVVVYSTSTGTAAFNTGSGWYPGSTFSLVNNGSIIGMGGNGGSGGSAAVGGVGGSGGVALNLTLAATITNANGSGTLAGGGGGGGGGGSSNWVGGTYYSGGGGGGGGQSYQNTSGGAAGAQVNLHTELDAPAAGSGGTSAGAGGGGLGGRQGSIDKGVTTVESEGGTGGTGGGYGATGNTGGTGSVNPGFWGGSAGGAGGAGGYYLVKNGNSVTWISNGTRLGSEV